VLYSMTGYGEAVHDDDRIRVGFRLRTVNNKGLDISLKLPYELMYLEPRLRDVVKRRLFRGRVDVYSEIEIRDEEVQPPAPLNGSRLAQIAEAVGTMKSRHGIGGELDVNTLLRIPDLMTAQRVGFKLPEELEDAIIATMEAALTALEKSRSREGEKLKTDFSKRITALRERVASLEEMTVKRQAEMRDQIAGRIETLLADKGLDESRLMQEVVYTADRLDISEEITRMKTHLSTFQTLLDNDKRPLGKELDFIIQEQMRESTTIGNKAKNEWIATHVVGFKTGFEKIREQLANIE